MPSKPTRTVDATSSARILGRAAGRVAGIDLATRCGWAVIDWPSEDLEAMGTWDLQVRPYEGTGMRVLRFRNLLTEFVERTRPDVLVYEYVRQHMNKWHKQEAQTEAARVWGELRGVLLGLAESWRGPDGRKLPVAFIEVGTWKRAACGKGNAKKETIKEWACETYGTLPWFVRQQDAIDAVGVALGWARENWRTP